LQTQHFYINRKVVSALLLILASHPRLGYAFPDNGLSPVQREEMLKLNAVVCLQKSEFDQLPQAEKIPVKLMGRVQDLDQMKLENAYSYHAFQKPSDDDDIKDPHTSVQELQQDLQALQDQLSKLQSAFNKKLSEATGRLGKSYVSESATVDQDDSLGDQDTQIKITLYRIEYIKEKLAVLNQPDPKSAEIITQHQNLEKDIVYNQFLNTFEYEPNTPTCDLSLEELFSLFAYTTTGDAYDRLNMALSSGGTEEQYAPFRDVLTAALKKIRPYQGIVKRGTTLSEEDLKKYVVGDILPPMKGFTSTSLFEAFPGNVQEEIKSQTGRYIAPFSPNYGEAEVLFLPGVYFRVVSKVLDQTKQIYHIKLEEVLASQTPSPSK